jgi:hypothetical protein
MNWGICKMGRFREEDPKGEVGKNWGINLFKFWGDKI